MSRLQALILVAMIPLWLRLSLGIAFFAILAVRDVLRRGKSATRWREYLFLLLCVVVAMGYGAANDQITSRISWEYFYYGKELWPILGPSTPPAAAELAWQAARIGVAATWWAGLIAGVAMLIANNPRADQPQLAYRKLIARLPVFVLIVVSCALVFGMLGQLFLLNWISPDFRQLASDNLWRPHHFMAVYGIHFGGYMGGVLGTIYAIFSIRRERSTLRPVQQGLQA
jgi:hypothetical protein